jgi:hypothetical protein
MGRRAFKDSPDFVINEKCPKMRDQVWQPKACLILIMLTPSYITVEITLETSS